MSNVIPFPSRPSTNSLSALSFEESQIEMILLWPLPGNGNTLPLVFKAKDVNLALAAIKGDQAAFLELAEMNGYELA